MLLAVYIYVTYILYTYMLYTVYMLLYICSIRYTYMLYTIYTTYILYTIYMFYTIYCIYMFYILYCIFIYKYIWMPRASTTRKRRGRRRGLYALCALEFICEAVSSFPSGLIDFVMSCYRRSYTAAIYIHIYIKFKVSFLGIKKVTLIYNSFTQHLNGLKGQMAATRFPVDVAHESGLCGTVPVPTLSTRDIHFGSCD
jgi:hypothetical protein